MTKSLRIIAIMAFGLVFKPLISQNALGFDGTDDRVDCGTDTSVMIQGQKITLEAWIYPTAWKTNFYDGNVICKEDNKSNYGYMLRVGDGGKLNFAIGDGGWKELTTSTGYLSLNTWQHIAGTYDGTKMRIFINGVAVDSTSVSTSIISTNAANLEIGAHLTYNRFYQGLIDEVRVWNIWRSEAEIYNGMNDEICSRNKGLRAYYKFNQGKAGGINTGIKTVTDLSGFGNTGTMTFFALTGTTSNWLKGVTLKKAATISHDTLIRCDRYTSPSGKRWTVSGIYKDTIPTVMGCDSAMTIYLTIKKSTAKTIKAHACTSYQSPSGVYTWTKSGVYTDYLRNSVNCDSILTIVLTIGGGRDTIAPKVCKSYTVPSGKRLYTQSGWFSDTLVDYRGCDSVIAIDLTILAPTYGSMKVNECHSYTSPSGKYTYTKNGIYFDTLINVVGCDSFITISLAIKESSGAVNVKTCEQWTSPSGKYIWKTSGTYKDTIKNHFGCDSFMVVNLTVNQPTTGDLHPTACRSYVSPSKKYVWKAAGTYQDTIANYLGCDSVITVLLSMPNINVNVSQSGPVLTAAVSSGTYQWMNCKPNFAPISGETNRAYTATSTGSYAVEITELGCKDTSNCIAVTISGTTELQAKNIFSLVPNPGNGNFEIVLPNSCENAAVLVRDISGKIVYQNSYKILQRAAIQLDQSNGIYSVEIRSATLSGTQFLVIEK
jgi:hypothetical protein